MSEVEQIPTPETDQEREARRLRQAEVLSLRRDGWSFEEIGLKLGISRARAHTLYNNGLAGYKGKYRESHQDALALDLHRLDYLFTCLVPLAARGRQGDRAAPRAVEVLLKVLERRARLHGLDAPIRTESLVARADLSPAQLIAMARQMGLPIPEDLGPPPALTYVPPTALIEDARVVESVPATPEPPTPSPETPP